MGLWDTMNQVYQGGRSADVYPFLSDWSAQNALGL